MLNWLSDLLMPICILNKTLQQSSFQLGNLKDNLDSTIQILQSDYIDYEKPPLIHIDDESNKSLDCILKHHLKYGGFFLGLFIDKCTFFNQNEVNYQFREEEEIKENLLLDYEKLRAFELKFLVDKVSKYLVEEFMNIIPGKTNFYKNFLIFNINNFTGKSSQFINEYGNQEFLNLINYFFANNSKFQEKEIIIFQWKKFKLKLNEYYLKNVNSSSPNISLNIIFSDPYFETGFDELKDIIKIHMTIPSSNAEVERGFSAMKRIKTLLRNRMGTNLMDKLMNISLNGEEIANWNPEESINYWIKKNDLRNF